MDCRMSQRKTHISRRVLMSSLHFRRWKWRSNSAPLHKSESNRCTEFSRVNSSATARRCFREARRRRGYSLQMWGPVDIRSSSGSFLNRLIVHLQRSEVESFERRVFPRLQCMEASYSPSSLSTSYILTAVQRALRGVPQCKTLEKFRSGTSLSTCIVISYNTWMAADHSPEDSYGEAPGSYNRWDFGLTNWSRSTCKGRQEEIRHSTGHRCCDVCRRNDASFIRQLPTESWHISRKQRGLWLKTATESSVLVCWDIGGAGVQVVYTSRLCHIGSSAYWR